MAAMPSRENRTDRRSERRHLHAVPDETAPSPDGLFALLAEALDDPEPLAFLSLASSLAATLDPRTAELRDAFVDGAETAGMAGVDDFAGMFLESLIGTEARETTALLHALAALLPDNHLAQRARREARRRDHAVPDWLTGLDDAEPGPAISTTHPLGDGENTVVSASLPGGNALSAVVYIDHNLGTVAKDAFVVPQDAESFGRDFRQSAGETGDLSIAEIDPAEARSRIAQAIETGERLLPPLESDTWPACRPLVEWMIGLLPANGVGYVIDGLPDLERTRLTRQVLAAISSAGVRASDEAIVDELLEFAGNYVGGDPLRWSPTTVEILLSQWYPTTVPHDEDGLLRMPTVLRALIGYAHAQRGIPAHLTEETLQAVDAWEPTYTDIVLDADPDEGYGGVSPGGPADFLRELLHDVAVFGIARAEAAVGGPAELAMLDDEPLPDEPFDWDGIPEDIHPRVRTVLEFCDACADELFDAEVRTAFRRVLARTAAAEPAVFRRKSKDTTAAAAIAWAVAAANDLLNPYAGGMTAGELLAHFGVSGSISDRARPFLRAFGAPERQYAAELTFDSPAVLTSQRRAELIRLRDKEV